MAREIINIGAQDNDGTGDSLRLAGAKSNRMFQEIYLSLNDPKVAAVGQDLLLGSSSKIAIVTANMPAITSVINNMPAILNASMYASRAEAAAGVAQAFVNGLVYTTVAAGAAANPDGKVFAVIGTDPNAYATLYQVQTTTTSFTGGAMPAGASVKRAAGSYSRYKRVEYTDYDFTSGVLQPGVTVQRAAGQWSRPSQTGALELGTSANTARFAYDPPIENIMPNSSISSGFFSGPNNATVSSASDGIKYTVGATPANGFNIELFTAPSSNFVRTYSVDLRGEVGGEIVYLQARLNGNYVARRRFVLTTTYQRFDLSVTATEYGFGTDSNNEAIPAQTFYARRRQLNSGPIALAYAETTGTAIYVPPVCKGLMLEPERTNLLPNSQAVDLFVPAGGELAGLTVSANVGTAPDGTLTADLLVPTNNGGFSYASDYFVKTGGTDYALSSFMKGQGARWGHMSASTYQTGQMVSYFDLQNMTTGTTQPRAKSSAVRHGSYLRGIVAFTAPANDGPQYNLLGPAGADNSFNSSQITDTIYGWGIQLEVGSTASSYIPTTTGPATRPVEAIRVAVPTLADGSYLCSLYYAPGSYGGSDGDVTLAAVVSGVMTVRVPDSGNPGILQRLRIPGLPSAIMELGTAADTPRFDYDPKTGASRGVLIEPACTNYIRSSRSPEGSVWFRRNAGKVRTTAFTRVDGTPGGRLMSVGFEGQDLYENGDDIPAAAGDPSFYIWPISNVGQLNIREPNLDNGKWTIDLSKVQAGAWTRIHRDHPAVTIVLEFGRRAVWFSSATGAFLDFYVDAIQASSRPLTSYVDRPGTAVATRPLETLALSGGSGTYRVAFDNGSFQDMALTATAGAISIPATALNRYNVMSVTAMVPVALGSVAGKSVTDELVRAMQRVGVYPEQFGAVGDGIADDTVPLQAAANTGMNILFMPGKTYKIDKADGGIQLKPGQLVTGYQPGRSGSIQRTYLFNNATGGGIFWYTQDTSTGDVKMPKISNLSMSADYPVRLNDERTAILKDGAASNVPPGKKPAVVNCDITARVAGQGIGISWSKMFDGEITGCDIVGFDINVLLNGCDLNRVEHNRMQIAARRHVLELGGGSFGSQNVIRHNDLLEVGTNGIHIQSTGRHRRISDNYHEQGGQCLGFIDCSTVGAISYAGNVASEQFTTIVRDNRIDGKANATQFIYRYQAEGQTYGEFVDVGTSGSPRSVPGLALVNAAGTILNAVPFIFNQTNKASFAFQGPDFGIWNGYRTVETPSLRITGRNVCQFNAPAIEADKSGLYLRGRDELLVLLPRPSGSTDDPVFNFIFDAASRFFTAGTTCIAEYVARAPGAAETLGIGSKVDGAGGALANAALTTSFRKVLTQFTAGTSNGCYLKRSHNGGEIEIRTLRIYPLYAQEIPFTSAASATMGLEQIEGLIEVYGEGAGGGAPASYVYGFANNRLVKLGESVTNADALAVTTTQSSDLSTLTFTLSGSGGGKQFTVRRKTLA